MLDEGLAVLDRLWSGEMVTHHGQHYDVENVSLAPLPFQRPRIPIWIGGESPPALRRAARWDGWLAPATSPDGTPIMDKDPGRIAEMVAEIRRHRTTDTPFAVAVDGYSEPGDPTLPHAYQVAGATWWLESIHGMRGPLDEMIARVGGTPGAEVRVRCRLDAHCRCKSEAIGDDRTGERVQVDLGAIPALKGERCER